MMDLQIVATAGCTDLSLFVQVRENRLEVAENVMRVLRRYNIQSAFALVGFLQAFPGSMASELGWDIKRLRRAHAQLLQVLRQVLPAEVLVRRSHHHVSFGANRPGDKGREAEAEGGWWATGTVLEPYLREVLGDPNEVVSPAGLDQYLDRSILDRPK